MGKEGSGLARAQGPGGLRERCGFRCSRGLRPPCTQAASDSSMPPGAPPLQSPVPCRLPYLAFPQFAPFLSSLETLSEPLSSLVCDPEEMWGSSLESHPLRQTWRASLSLPRCRPTFPDWRTFKRNSSFLQHPPRPAPRRENRPWTLPPASPPLLLLCKLHLRCFRVRGPFGALRHPL